jgi:peptide/nickel transport system ATP-binding protein
VRARAGGAPRAAGGAAPRARGAAAARPLLEVRDLKVHFPIRRGVLRRTVGHVKAVDGVTLAVAEGRTLALVGESGSGKTTVGKAILQLIRPTAGSVRYAGEELTSLARAAMKRHRAAMQIVFQDPYASLNPRMRVADILAEGMRSLGVGSTEAERARRIGALLEQVGLPADAHSRYPHEFSGGQRQRVAIARALAVEPRLIVCDEPTSALDVSVQAQILNLLRALQERLGLAYLFITHNLAVVEYLAHEVAVMRGGQIVEQGPAAQVLGAPRHDYTRALLAAVPKVD